MGYSVTLRQGEEEVYWEDWGGSVSQLLEEAFPDSIKSLDGVNARKAVRVLQEGLHTLMIDEDYFLDKYPDSQWKFLNLCTHLFNLWKACKEYPEATLSLCY